MQVNSYEEYLNLRDEVLARKRQEVLESADAEAAVAKLDSDNRHYFIEYVNDAKGALLSLALAGVVDDSVLESGVDRLDLYMQSVLDLPTDEEKEYTEMMNAVENIKLGLYTECQNGNISIEERERGLARINEIATECSNIDDLEEALPGVVSEGFIDKTKTVIGKVTPHVITINFKGKVMNLKLVTKPGIDAKKIKEKFNGIECENSKTVKANLQRSIKEKAAQIASNADGKNPSIALKAKQYAAKPVDDIYNDLRAKYVNANGASIEVVCKHKFLDKKSFVAIKFDRTGKFQSLALRMSDSGINESVIDDMMYDILNNSALDLAEDSFVL